jgi:FkbM family methyltransferase
MEGLLPMINMRYLLFLKKLGFAPNIFYDIGSSDGRWSMIMNHIFNNIKCYTFDADNKSNSQFKVCLSNKDGDIIKFYRHSEYVSSYFLCNNESCNIYDELNTYKLDTFVTEHSLEQPNIIKINCCGAEKDIIDGALDTIKQCKYLIVTLNNYEIFTDAPIAKEVGPYIESLGFEMVDALDNSGLGIVDYVFKNKNL